MTAPRDIAAVAKQIGGELLPDNAQWHNRFQIQSRTSPSLYTIAQRNTDDTWGCSCPGWRHHRRCKHLTDVLQRLVKVAASAIMATFDEATKAMLASARAALDMDTPIEIKEQPHTKGRQVDFDI